MERLLDEQGLEQLLRMVGGCPHCSWEAPPRYHRLVRLASPITPRSVHLSCSVCQLKWSITTHQLINLCIRRERDLKAKLEENKQKEDWSQEEHAELSIRAKLYGGIRENLTAFAVPESRRGFTKAERRLTHEERVAIARAEGERIGRLRLHAANKATDKATFSE